MDRRCGVRGVLVAAAMATLLTRPVPAAGYAGFRGDAPEVSALIGRDRTGMDRFELPYDPARVAFRQDAARARAAGIHVETGAIPVPSRRCGDGVLTIDWAHYRGKASGSGNPSLVVYLSGTHGIEGHAGSAIQARMAVPDRLRSILDAGLDVLLVHALNPYGFSQDKRGTESGIDLNRNCAVAGDALFKTANEGYEALRDVLEPAGKVRHPRLGAARVVGGILGKLARGTSVEKLVQAIAGGQYTSPEGLFYGGSGPEQPVLELARMFAERIGAYDRGAVLDLHTGYGPRGAGMLIPADASSAAVAQALVGEPQREAGILLASDPRGGIYNPSGTVLGFLGQQLTAQQQESLGLLGVEYATLGASLPRKLQALAIMVLEKQGRHHGYVTDQARDTVARWFQELFNPADPLWQARVLRQHDVLLQALLERYGTGESGSLSAVR